MSSRTFTSGPYAVLTGWDARLQQVYLEIEDLRVSEDDDARIVYSNLSDVDARAGGGGCGVTHAQLAARLAAVGIGAPPALLADLREDEASDRMHETTDYGDYPMVAAAGPGTG